MITLVLLLFVVLLLGFAVGIAYLATHSSRIRRLEQQVRSLSSLAAGLESQLREILKPSAAGSDRGAADGGREPVTMPAAAQQKVSAKQLEPLLPSAAPSIPPAPISLPHEVREKPPSKPSRTREEWEALIGGKLLNRIGAFALIIAVGLFLKYAFDNDLITETLRVVIGFLIGSACLITAARSARKGFEVFAQGLVGAGLAILYLSVFASFNFYDLVSQPVAFVLMSAVTLLAFTQAFRYDALAVSLLGLLGGFLTPFLLSTGEDNFVGLFTYVVLLDLGMLIVLARKDGWMILEPLALLGTYIIYWTWYAAYYAEEKLWPVLLFLAMFWVLFHGLDLLRVRRRSVAFPEARRVMGIAHSLVVYAALLVLFHSRSDEEQAAASLVFGLLYAASAFLTGRRKSEQRFPFAQYMVTGILLSFAAVFIHFEGFPRVLVWALISVGLGWLGLKGEQKSIWTTSLILLPFSWIMLLDVSGAFAYQPLESFRLILNERALTFAVVAGALGIVGFMYRRMAPAPSVKLQELLQYGWLLVLITGICVETNDLFRQWMIGMSESSREHLSYQRLMAIAGVSGLFGISFAGFGLGAKVRPVFYASLWVLLGAACLAGIRGLWYSPTEAFVPLLNLRVAVFLILVAGFFGVSNVLAKFPGMFEWQDEFRAISSYAPILLLIVLLSSESWDLFEREQLNAQMLARGESSGEVVRLLNLQQLTLSAVWLVFSIVLMVVGLVRRERGRRFLAIGLFGIAILKIFIYDLSFLESLYRIFSFVGLGVILLVVSYLYQRYRDVILGTAAGPRA